MATLSLLPTPTAHSFFSIGGFTFERDRDTVRIQYPGGHDELALTDFLAALEEDMSWGLFNNGGIINFFAGQNRGGGKPDYSEFFPAADLRRLFQQILTAWNPARESKQPCARCTSGLCQKPLRG